MTRQAWTALVAAVAFVLSAVAVLLAPVDYVAWSPGSTADTLGEVGGKPLITVTGVKTYPTTGQMELTTVLQTSADSRLSLPEAVWSYFLPHRDVLPRDTIYPENQTPAEAEQQEVEAMKSAQGTAVVAALLAAGQPSFPQVASVVVDGQSDQKLKPGDRIVSVDGVETATVADVGTQIRSRPAGSRVEFMVRRGGRSVRVVVTSRPPGTGEAVGPKVDIGLSTGFVTEPDISYELGEQIGGPSAGLAFGIAIYDKVTPGALLDGRHVAGTGTIDADGSVGPIGGIQEKIAGAQDAGASVFFVPAANCTDLAGVKTDLNLIKVDTLKSAISSLEALQTGGSAAAGVPRC